MELDVAAGGARLAVSLGIGLLLGLERERRKGDGPGRGTAGARTFALVALAGGLAALIGNEALFAVAAAGVVALAVAGYLVSDHLDPGLTSEVALLVAFLLGGLAIEEPGVAAACAVVVVVLLATREGIHRFARSVVTPEELHDALIFLAAALVVLPLVPDRDLGPAGALNPFGIWRVVVLVMAVGGLGHIALRSVGPGYGLPLAGLAAGFVSSTATVAAMGRRARSNRALLGPAVAGAVFSTVATVVQMAVVLAATDQRVLRELTPALVLAGGAALASGAVAAARALRAPADAVDAGRAFELRPALLFAALLTAVLLLAALANERFGETGVLLGAALAGFADTHAAAISVAALAATGAIDPGAAALPVLAGLTTNTGTKLIAAAVAGGPKYALAVGCGLIAVLAGAWAGYLLA